MDEDLAWFSLELSKYPLPAVDPTQLAGLFGHYEMLRRWNPKMNLTSIQSPAEIVRRHYAESLFFSACLSLSSSTVADVGSGPGFPGVPLAILYPQLPVCLIESHQRKAVFLRESTRHLSNVEVIASRAESVERRFDWVVSRAVDPMDVVALLPRLAPKVGLLVGALDYQSLKATPVSWAEPVPVPWADRQLVAWGVSRGTSE